METNARIQSLGAVLLLLFKGYTAANKYRVDKTLRTWDGANKACSLFTPTFTRYNEGFDLQGADETMEDNKIWTGYIKSYHDFAYVGCINVNRINATSSTKFEYSANPGLCFAECGGHKFFGIGHDGYRKWSCYCFRNRPDTRFDRESECTKECGEDTHVACGRWTGSVWAGYQYFVSVYQDVGISTSESDLCRSYDPQTPSFQWEQCSHRLYTMCSNSTASSTVNVPKGDGYKWHQAIKKCLDDGQYPLYNAINHPKLPSRDKHTENLWTAVFRSLTIRKVSDSSSNGISPIEYGYLEHDWGSEFFLKFTSNLNDEGISLCSIASPPVSVATSTVTSEDRDTTPENIQSTASSSFDSDSTTASDLTSSKEPTVSVPVGLYSTQITSTPESLGPTATPVSEITTGPTELDNTADKLTSGDDKSQVGSYVGIVIGILVLLLLLGAAVFYFRRRRKQSAKDCTGAHVNYSYAEPGTVQIVQRPDNPSIDHPRNDYENHTAAYDTITDDKADQPVTEDEYTYIPTEHMNHIAQDDEQCAQNVYQVLEKEEASENNVPPTFARANGAMHEHTTDESEQEPTNGCHSQSQDDLPGHSRRIPASAANSDDYDVSGIKLKEGNTSENVYNRTDFGGDDDADNYDRTWGDTKGQGRAGTGSENVYNKATHVESGTGDAMYDHSNQSQHRQLSVDPLYSKAMYTQ